MDGCGLPENNFKASRLQQPQLKQQEMSLLPPDHPFLQEFQRKLKAYLLQTKEKLLTDIHDLENSVNAREKQRTRDGCRLSEMHQTLDQQREQLLEYETNLQMTAQKRKEEEELAAKLKVENDIKSKQVKEFKALYQKRFAELEQLQVLRFNLKKWTNEIEDEVKNAQRVVSRDAQIQKQIAEEKSKSDLLLLYLDIEIKKFEDQLNIIMQEKADMAYCINVLNESLSNSHADIEALQNEHKLMTVSWSEVITALSHRDKILFQVKSLIQKERNSIKLSNCEISGIQKQTAKELQQTKKLDYFKNRLAEALNILKVECQKQSDVINGLEKKLEALPKLLNQTAQDLKFAHKEGTQLESEVRRIQRKIDKKNNKKYEFEENLIKAAQEKLKNNLASGHHLKILNSNQEQRRALELRLAKAQKKLAETFLNIETCKAAIQREQQKTDALKEQLNTEQSKSNQLSMETKEMLNQIRLKSLVKENLSNQLCQLKSENVGEFSETEAKIKELESSIQNDEHQVREKQDFWLILQNHCVKLSKKRSMQQSEFQVSQKQLSIVKQKLLKVDLDLEKSADTKSKLICENEAYLTKFKLLNHKVFEKRQQHNDEETECEMEHSELLQKLKDNEMQVLAMEEVIIELQTDIEQFKDLVLDKHRQALSWEAKCKVVEETLRSRKAEGSRESEINLIKTENRKMQLRYENLQCAQQKFAKEMEHCVSHFEHIENTASLQRHIEGQPKYANSNITKQKNKIIYLRNNISKIKSDVETLKNRDLRERQYENDRMNEFAKQAHDDALQSENENKKMLDHIDEAILQKQYNLNTIVSKQNRAKLYKRLDGAKLPQLKRTKATLEKELRKQKAIQAKLIETLRNVYKTFPENKMNLLKLETVLKD